MKSFWNKQQPFSDSPPSLLCSSLFPAHLPNSRVLLPNSHNYDAVSLTDAPLGPRGQCVVSLVKNYAMDVFLLAQPAG